MLTRETCPVCNSAFGFVWVDNEKDAHVRMCSSRPSASANLVLEVNLEGHRAGYGHPSDDDALIVRYLGPDSTHVTGLTYLGARGLTLAAWTDARHGEAVGPTIDAAVRAWLALPLEERCSS